jgi:hypothetical protein
MWFVIVCAMLALLIPVAFVLVGACRHFLGREDDPEQK